MLKSIDGIPKSTCIRDQVSFREQSGNSKTGFEENTRNEQSKMEAHLLKGGTNAKATDSDLSKVVIVDKTSHVMHSKGRYATTLQ